MNALTKYMVQLLLFFFIIIICVIFPKFFKIKLDVLSVEIFIFLESETRIHSII